MKILEKEIPDCGECDFCETQTYTIPDENDSSNNHHKTLYYAFCRKYNKFIISITPYRHNIGLTKNKFPEFCKLKDA